MAEQLTRVRLDVQGDREFRGAFSSSQKAANDAFERINKGSDKTRKSLERTDASARLVSKGMKTLNTGVLTFTRNVAGLASGVVGFQALASAIGNAVGAALDFDDAYTTVLTLVDETEPAVRGLRQELLELPPVLGSGAELAEALYQTLSAGVEPAESVRFVGEAAEFAVAGLTSAEKAVDVLSTIINAYGLEAEDAADISDILFTTIRLGKTDADQLASSLGSVIPTASLLGVEIDNLGAVLATLTAGGFSTDAAVTGINRTFETFLKRASDFEDAGIDILGLLGQNNLLGAFQAIEEATEGDATAIRELTKDSLAFRTTAALMGTQLESLEQNVTEMADSLGAGDAALEARLSSARLRMQEFGNAMNRVIERSGFSEFLADIFAGLTSVVETFHPEGTTAFTLFAEDALTAGGAIRSLFNETTDLTDALNEQARQEERTAEITRRRREFERERAAEQHKEFLQQRRERIESEAAAAAEIDQIRRRDAANAAHAAQTIQAMREQQAQEQEQSIIRIDTVFRVLEERQTRQQAFELQQRKQRYMTFVSSIVRSGSHMVRSLVDNWRRGTFTMQNLWQRFQSILLNLAFRAGERLAENLLGRALNALLPSSGGGSIVGDIFRGVGSFAGLIPGVGGFIQTGLNFIGGLFGRHGLAMQAPAFQRGGSLTVPGAGAPDSRLMTARVSPGERIIVRPGMEDVEILRDVASLQDEGIQIQRLMLTEMRQMREGMQALQRTVQRQGLLLEARV